MEKELDGLLEKEEMWWSQRAKTLWISHGDKNTKFFHQKANHCRRKNNIDTIRDQLDVTHSEKAEIEDIFMNHFKLLFTTQHPTNISDTTKVVQNRISHEMYEHLDKEFTAEEVLTAITDMKGLAAPGPDGLPARFYHMYWDIIGNDITREVLHILNNKGNPTP
jgi:phenylalanyl-tRNA synthetase alpha subunit